MLLSSIASWLINQKEHNDRIDPIVALNYYKTAEQQTSTFNVKENYIYIYIRDRWFRVLCRKDMGTVDDNNPLLFSFCHKII